MIQLFLLPLTFDRFHALGGSQFSPVLDVEGVHKAVFLRERKPKPFRYTGSLSSAMVSSLRQEELVIEGYRQFVPHFAGVYYSYTPQMARENFALFLQGIPERLAQLRIAMDATGASDIVLDYSDASLADLGGWFTHRVALRTLTPEEKSRRFVDMPAWFAPIQSDTDLTDLSYSLSVDVGIYFGECMCHAHPQLRWELLKRPKNSVDFNQPVLVRFRATMQLNPVTVALVVASKSVEGVSGREEIIRIKQVWDSYVIEPAQ